VRHELKLCSVIILDGDIATLISLFMLWCIPLDGRLFITAALVLRSLAADIYMPSRLLSDLSFVLLALWYLSVPGLAPDSRSGDVDPLPTLNAIIDWWHT